jgi:uncharacterized membrane protein
VEHGAKRAFHPLDPRSARFRFALALAAAVVAYFVASAFVGSWSLRGMAGWDAFATVATSISLIIILRSNSRETKRRASAEDPGRAAVNVVALASSAFSLFAALVAVHDARTMHTPEREVWMVLAIAAIALSWLLTHASYALRYAHLYYAEAKTGGGLAFPGNEAPTDLDFAYFSFTVGMTFQVSDVTVQSARIRRTVLLHALISFVYNTTIIGLSLALMASLLT